CPPATKSLPSGNAAAPLQKMLSPTVTEVKLFVAGSQTRASWPADWASDANTRPVGSKAICTATMGQSKGPDHCPTSLSGGAPRNATSCMIQGPGLPSGALALYRRAADTTRSSAMLPSGVITRLVNPG